MTPIQILISIAIAFIIGFFVGEAFAYKQLREVKVQTTEKPKITDIKVPVMPKAKVAAAKKKAAKKKTK